MPQKERFFVDKQEIFGYFFLALRSGGQKQGLAYRFFHFRSPLMR